MLISHKYKFITIDIPKTGTKTLRQTLLPVIPIDVIGKGDNPNDYFYQHCNVNACERGFKKRGWDFNSYKKFSTLRNPWKRYVSFLMYKINKGNDKCLVIDLIKKHEGDMEKVTKEYYECWKESKEE